MAFDPSIWRLGAAQALDRSVGRLALPYRLLCSERRLTASCVRFPGSTSSTGGVRVAVVDPGGSPAAVSSTSGTFLPANWLQNYKVTPGQKLSAISNDAGTPSLSITELTY